MFRPTLAAAALAAWVLLSAPWVLPAPSAAPPRPAVSAGSAGSVGEAYAARRSGVWVRVRGWVVRILRDDLRGARHQRFILRLKGGMTLLVSHNIDLARRVPLAGGEEVEASGRYEWNPKGGTLHWTHHDPRGRREGGWIRHRGVLYR